MLAEVKQTVLLAVTVQYAVSYQTSLQLRNNAFRHADVAVSFDTTVFAKLALPYSVLRTL